MTPPSRAALKPRKSPRQARSAVTVEAIFTATIQVLLVEGASRLTTTRVAERAGVSVGTMYQYFPHKQALLYAVLQQQLESVAHTMELAADRLAGQKMVAISEGLVTAWLDAKTKDIDASRALYAIATDFDIADLIADGATRIQVSMARLLESAADVAFENPEAVAFVLLSVLGGAVRSVLERGARPAEVTMLRAELPIVCRAYLSASATALPAL